MGANFNYYTYRGGKTELPSHHKVLQEEECEIHGNDTYAGHIGIMPSGINFVERKAFENEEQAREYLEDNHKKWDRAMAVPFKGTGVVYDKASQLLRDQRNKVTAELTTLEADILLSIRSTKSKTIGCKKCGSSVSRLYITCADCPVCGKRETFYSKTQAERIKRKRDKLRQLNSKSLKQTQTITTCYVVGGWCVE